MAGQSRQASTCRHSGQSFMEDRVGQHTGSYTKAPNPSSGSSPGRPAPWLFHTHVSHASSLSPASAASSTPGEEGDIRSGMARTEGHWTLPQVAVSGNLPSALQGPLLLLDAAREAIKSCRWGPGSPSASPE